MAYAEQTTVTIDKSKQEIERMLQRQGATSFIYGWDDRTACLLFKMKGRQIRFNLQMPLQTDKQFTYTENRHTRRSPSATFNAWEQACRSRWRTLALVIKAKLEAANSGITSFEDEFLAHTVLPGNLTVGQLIHPQIAEAYETGNMPPLLLEYK